MDEPSVGPDAASLFDPANAMRVIALIEQMADAVSVATDFFTARDEMYGAVLAPDPVRLSPITVMMQEALEAWRKWKFG